MANNRIARVNSDVIKTLAELFRDVKDPRINQGMLTVTAAHVTPDLKYCKVWLSIFAQLDEKAFRQGLKSCSGWLRRELARRLNLRQTPELTFVVDHSMEQGAHITKMLSQMDLSPAEESTNEDID